ncbi:hypothetical protein S7711_08587 [Stachybotrys chartarum IBT 7711]|uniref:GDP/GTP exchange factor Sec2 N-terminal domain-containing protein n=1 Tax=Stachybotrys chartarum (strain CBS 109288 / IBT 7711) TaxID=1280523 RepID=A0A084AJH8_STACB|nr:hypothetical protein S7711_08587 [Stachybotrys chartarum IBT 7711]
MSWKLGHLGPGSVGDTHFIHMAAPNWTPSPDRTYGHFSSISVSSSPAPQKPRAAVKYASTSQLPTLSSPPARRSLDDEMSTLPDPRNRSQASDSDEGDSSPRHHPDLSNEVAMLSTKLINAINHQTVLDDTLSATRHELETANKRVRELEAQVASQREMLAGDVWVRRSIVDAERRAMQSKVAEEAAKRTATEEEKKKIEQELESLSTALFEEANNMVIRAKEDAQAEHEVVQRKNDQLRAQLADNEGLLKSQQEQLSELKQVMEMMLTEQDDQAHGTAPSSPGFSKPDIGEGESTTITDGTVNSPTTEALPVAHPTSFQHLIQPVLRTDLNFYQDFVTLARVSRKRSGSRVSSGSIGGINALSMALGGSTSSAHPSNSSTTSFTTAATSNSAPQSPNTPASTVSTGSAPGMPLPTLRETRFFKRILAEDIEPTLRLDVAPGLSWLNRRSVINAVSDGSLVVEPVPATTSYVMITKPQHYPCSLCGETRKDPAYLRNHRFKISETDSAQRYPLCKYCLARVRSTCELIGFLRMLKDGHWRADTEDHEKAAWEESVRLREQMFWARIGGGVVPATQVGIASEAGRSPRVSTEQDRAADATTIASSGPAKDVDAPVLSPKDVTFGASLSPRDDGAADDAKTITEPHTPPKQTDSSNSPRNSTQPLEGNSISGSEVTNRLSITIPSKE